MGLSRTLISMLALDVARYENGSRESLLQTFHQLSAHAPIREKLGDLSDAALLHAVEHSTFTKASETDQFANHWSSETMGKSLLPKLAGTARVSRVRVRRRLP